MKNVQEEKDIVTQNRAYFAAKIVRGAYLEKERKLAKENG